MRPLRRISPARYAPAPCARWAGEGKPLLATATGGGAVRRPPRQPGLVALEERGLTYVEGTELTELARVIKSPSEIKLMRWTIRVCEAGIARIYDHSVPGATERELWAHLHFENARSGSDWLETKLLTCGSHTNP